MKKTLILYLFLFSQQILAHTTSDSYLNINLSEQESNISWSIAIRDLEYAVGIDTDNNNKITWSEILQRKTDIEAYVLSRLAIYTTKDQVKQLCTINNDSLMVNEKSNGNYLVFNIITSCLADASNTIIEIDYQLLFDIDANHLGLLLIQTDELSNDSNTVTFVASPDNHTFIIKSGATKSASIFSDYVSEGIWHILIGLDHILFLLALLLPSVLLYNHGRWQQRDSIRCSFKPILKIVTAFTVAHSITLTLSVLQIVQIPAQWIEIVIAITVLLTCLHTIKPIFQHSLWKLTFFFGLIHGFGFANVLLNLGLEKTALAISLFGFNVGVEIGQLFIVCIFMFFTATVHRHWWYHTFIFKGGILITTGLSCIWIFERIFNYEILGV